MPTVSRTFIKAGMVYFVLSLVAGLLLEIDALSLPFLMPLFWHMLMVGWITQIIFGVSIWMFPGRNREEGFANQRWSWLTFIFLNTGLVLRLVAEPVISYSEAEIWRLLLVGSAVLQVAGGASYVIEMWPRIMSKKQQRKKRKKKRQKGNQ
ncbi:MAG: hypothetical protein U5J63_13890 [Fodinibius sp.]|nr:hypothetical protein [Fodinibius sp.]